MSRRPSREDLVAATARLRGSVLERSRRVRPRRLPPTSPLSERWTAVDGVRVFYRETPTLDPGSRVLMHLHGFGLSGRYLLPTAERLSGEFHTLVPDLPGFGRSENAAERLDVTGLAHAAASFL